MIGLRRGPAWHGEAGYGGARHRHGTALLGEAEHSTATRGSRQGQSSRGGVPASQLTYYSIYASRASRYTLREVC